MEPVSTAQAPQNPTKLQERNIAYDSCWIWVCRGFRVVEADNENLIVVRKSRAELIIYQRAHERKSAAMYVHV